MDSVQMLDNLNVGAELEDWPLQGPDPLATPEVSAHRSGAGRRASHPQIKLSEQLQLTDYTHFTDVAPHVSH